MTGACNVFTLVQYSYAFLQVLQVCERGVLASVSQERPFGARTGF